MAADRIVGRVRRALLLDPTAFEEVRDDGAWTPICLGLAAAALLLGGLGSFLWGLLALDNRPSGFFVDTFILGGVFLILLWLAGIAVTYVVLTQIYREQIAPDALVRVVTLGHVPFALSFFVWIPGIGFGFGLLAIAAMFFYTIFGLRAAYPALDPFRTLVSVLAGFAVWAMVLPLLSSSGDAFSPGTFVFEWTADVTQDIGNFDVKLSDFKIDFGTPSR